MNEKVDVIKSESDDRDYKFLILDNKLRILLVSDPTAETSAAAVNVNVGSSSDPDSVPGIAHFCEHMLFLGTEKYPVEGEFDEFLSQNGGSSNASTSGEHTIYFFDVKSESLFPALDRFAQFFLCPLFNASSTERELNAIDSEHQKNILNDSRRKYFIKHSTSKPGHIYQRFGTGNIETLKTVPEEKNIDIRKLLLEFHTKYYSANIMTVVVLGREPVEELEKIAVPLFTNMSNKEVELPPCNEYPYGNDELGVVVKIPPVKELKTLELAFTLPDMREHYKTKPWRYISHLIGHEGEGSLLMYLQKKKTWVNTLSAGGYGVLKGFEFFDISMSLTDDGLTHIYDIIEVCFQYINMLKHDEPQSWIYDEMHMLNEIDFRFKNKERPAGYAKYLTRCMHLYEPEDVLYGPYRMDSFTPGMTTEILKSLEPSNFRCYVQSQSFEGKTDKVVKYYDAAYCIEKIPEELIEKWKNITPHPELHLPTENMFIAKSLDIVVPREQKEIKEVPSLIKDTEFIRVWYKADDTFFLPKAFVKLHISSPLTHMTPSHKNNLSMYCRLIKDELIEFAYDAELAGLTYSISSDQHCGISIKIGGFNSNQLVLLKEILHHVTKLDVKEERFSVNKVRLQESLINARMDEPYQQIGTLRNYFMLENTWSAEERLNYIDDLNVESLKSFICQFQKCIYVEALFCGNLLINDVEEICDVVEKCLIKDNCAKPMLPTQHLLPREYKLPKSSNYMHEKRSDTHANSCVHVYYQVGLKEKRLNVLCQLFSQIIHAPCFTTLRTEQQLGYIVSSGLANSTSVQGVKVCIQSDKCPTLVNDRIENFLDTFEKTLNDMSDEQFKDYVEGLAVRKLEKPKTLSAESNGYWSEISVKRYNYRRNESEVEELRSLTKPDVIQFYKTYISPSSKHRKKLTTVILGKDANSMVDGNKSWQLVDDVLKFKSGLPLYPHVMAYDNISLLSNTKQNSMKI